METRRGRGHLPVLVALAGIFVTLVAMAFVTESDRRVYHDELWERGAAATTRLVEVFNLADVSLSGVEGLFHASEFVTAREFADFVGQVGLVPGMTGIGYIDTVAPGSLGQFVAAARSEYGIFVPFALDDSMEPGPIDLGSTHQLLVYAAPIEAFGPMLGLDFASVPAVMPTLDDARATGSLMATPMLDSEGGTDLGEFILVDPIDGADGGFAAALMDLDRLVTAGVVDRVDDGDGLSVTQVVDRAQPPAPGDWTTIVHHAGHSWQITIHPAAPFSVWTPGRIALLVLGLVMSLGAARLVDLLGTNRAVRAQAAAFAASAAQTDRLLATVSHELRTPLTAIIGYLQELRLRWDRLDEGERREMVQTADVSAQDMSGLVSDLLVRERMLSGAPLVVDSVPVDLKEVIIGIVRSAESGHTVVADRSDPVRVWADPLAIDHAVRDLLSAAARPSGDHVTISIEADETGGVVTFTSGPIEPCCVPELFALDATSCVNHHVTGAHGFGLPVARFLARSMGGDVRYDRQGGRFVLQLSLVDESADARVA